MVLVTAWNSRYEACTRSNSSISGFLQFLYPIAFCMIDWQLVVLVLFFKGSRVRSKLLQKQIGVSSGSPLILFLYCWSHETIISGSHQVDLKHMFPLLRGAIKLSSLVYGTCVMYQT